jgi:RNA polymerase sigma-70 factor (ECF subfamily)
MANLKINDSDLISHFLNGNDACFETLLNRHKEKIFTTIIMIVKDRYVAEDIFQETFIKIVRMMRTGKYTDDGRFAQYAVRIARNMAIDYFRRTKKKPTINGEAGENILDNMSFAANKEQTMVKDETQQTIRNLVNELPDEQKEVLLLRHYGDMSFKEISELTQVPINTALGRMRYAIINLRKMIEQKSLVL